MGESPRPSPGGPGRHPRSKGPQTPPGSETARDADPPRLSLKGAAPISARLNAGRGRRATRGAWLVGTLAAVAVVGAIFAYVATAGRKSPPRQAVVETSAPGQPARSKPARGSDGPAGLAAPAVETVLCTVVAPEHGFYLLVDNEPARTDDGSLLETPCEVDLPVGTHRLRVVKQGWKDDPQELLISSPGRLELKSQFEPFGGASSFLSSPFTSMKVEEVLPLAALNGDGKVFDPFLSIDGLTLYFAGERSAGKGIYLARREGPFDAFGEPELIDATRGADHPASPSVTQDDLLLAYAAPLKSRVWVVSRESKFETFGHREMLKHTDADEEWPAALLSGDARTLYCLRRRGDDLRCFATVRAEREKPFDQKWMAAGLPGDQLCVSSDGRRAYAFDGARLQRATRRTRSDEFGEPALVAELTIPGYVHRPDSRQIWVSDDEQWLFYTDDPRDSGQLGVARLSAGRGWGFVPRGRTLRGKEFVAAGAPRRPSASPSSATMDEAPGSPSAVPEEAMTAEPGATAAEMPGKDMRAAEPAATPDLPYVVFRRTWEEALAKEDYATADDLLAKAQADPRLAPDREMLAADAAELAMLRSFTARLEQALSALKPGTTVRLGSTALEFVSYAAGQVTLKSRTKTLVKTLAELPPLDRVALVEQHGPAGDERQALESFVFLLRQPRTGSSAPIAARLQKAGELGRAFSARELDRRLHIIRAELAQGRVAQGLELIQQLSAAAPQSSQAQAAAQLRDALSSGLTWRPVGRQSWRTKDGELAATGQTEKNSYLVSGEQYGNFQLSLEWKSTGPGQGGVYFRFAGTGPPRGKSYKVQLANDLGAPVDHYSTGALFGVRPPKVNAVRKGGEWNTLVMRAAGRRLTVTVNEQTVLETNLEDAKIAPRGYVCLDGEFPGIIYRRVLVYELPADAAKPAGPSTKVRLEDDPAMEK